MLATDLHTQLDDLSGSLMQMIESVNAVSITPISGTVTGSAQDVVGLDDPITQIAQILSSHLESLQWIDAAVGEVEGKVTDVEKMVKESGVQNNNVNGGHKFRGFGANT
jgi:nuclear pore complex protein Nup62